MVNIKMDKNIENKELTYSEAIEKVIIDNGGYAPLKYIYENINRTQVIKNSQNLSGEVVFNS